MPRSLARGDYSLVMAIESSSRPNSWYRVLADRQSGHLSCDCPSWTFNRDQRSCLHTDFAGLLANGTAAQERTTVHTATVSPLLTATQQQWQGLRGTWHIEQADTRVGTHPYHVVLLRLGLGNGGSATGVVAFASRHHHTETEMIPGVAGWAGYAVAAEVARLGGFPMVGQPPDHFRIDRRPTPNRRQQPTPTTPSVGLADILRVGDIIDQGDGLTPRQRSTRTLRFFLGEETFGLLERQGFLDIPSTRYTREQRVYRLRRDPIQQRQRRIRVFQRGEYFKDFCVVLAQECPPDDLFLTEMLGLLSDEDDLLSVVNPSYNVFPPYSDGTERETIPAIWTPRAAASHL